MNWTILVGLVALGACSQVPDQERQNSSGRSAIDNAGEVVIPPVVETPAPAITPPPSDASARPDALIAREERENESCRGGSGDDPETMRACNRRQALLKQLQDSGWCWGGADIEADKRFVSCKPGDRDYSPGAFDQPYYTEAEIAEVSNGQ